MKKVKKLNFSSLARNTVALASLGSVFMSGTHRELMFGMKSFERFALRITPSIET